MKSTDYTFVFKNTESSCGKVHTITVPIDVAPTKPLLKRTARRMIDEADASGLKFALLEVYPVGVKKDVTQLPRLSRHTKEEHLYRYEVALGHVNHNATLKVEFCECSNAPYLLNAKRLKVVEDEYVRNEIRNGYEILGIAYLGEEAFHTEPVSDTVVENSRKSSKKDEYVWVKVKDGDDGNGINWIPARRTGANGEVVSFVGLMYTDDPDEDTRSFTDCPVPGYVISTTM